MHACMFSLTKLPYNKFFFSAGAGLGVHRVFLNFDFYKGTNDFDLLFLFLRFLEIKIFEFDHAIRNMNGF